MIRTLTHADISLLQQSLYAWVDQTRKGGSDHMTSAMLNTHFSAVDDAMALATRLVALNADDVLVVGPDPEVDDMDRYGITWTAVDPNCWMDQEANKQLGPEYDRRAFVGNVPVYRKGNSKRIGVMSCSMNVTVTPKAGDPVGRSALALAAQENQHHGRWHRERFERLRSTVPARDPWTDPKKGDHVMTYSHGGGIVTNVTEKSVMFYNVVRAMFGGSGRHRIPRKSWAEHESKGDAHVQHYAEWGPM